MVLDMDPENNGTKTCKEMVLDMDPENNGTKTCKEMVLDNMDPGKQRY